MTSLSYIIKDLTVYGTPTHFWASWVDIFYGNSAQEIIIGYLSIGDVVLIFRLTDDALEWVVAAAHAHWFRSRVNVVWLTGAHVSRMLVICNTGLATKRVIGRLLLRFHLINFSYAPLVCLLCASSGKMSRVALGRCCMSSGWLSCVLCLSGCRACIT